MNSGAPGKADRGWSRFLAIFLGVGGGLGLVLYGLLLVVDGYDTVFLSPRFDREPVTSNQRFSFPALARKDRFDSAIIGTSTTRLLRPEKLNPLFQARFVNLSMNDATAWEEAQLFGVFRRHHASPRAVIFGIDAVWCAVGDDFRRLTPRPFPAWMYDDNPWNDLLHLFNLPTVEETGRQLAYLTGTRRPKYGKDGYTNFLPPDSAYDLDRAQLRIYGPGGPRPRDASQPREEVTPAQAAAWRFPMHPLLVDMLDSLPAATVKILAVVPYHIYNQPLPRTPGEAVWAECKRRLAAMAAARTNVHLVDFMIESPITTRDENYWDPLHFRTGIADRLSDAMAEAVRSRRDGQDREFKGVYRYFGGSG
jgi:hypothetical protein